MNVASDPGVPKKKGFVKVTKSYNARGSARRQRAMATLNMHGLIAGNAELTQMVVRHAIARGVEPKDAILIDMGTDDVREVVAVWPTLVATPGTSTLRLYKNGTASSFHIGGAFEQSPNLRPLVKKSKCVVTEELDEQGLPVMIIAPKAGKATNTQSRPGDQAAAGEDA